MPIGAFRLNTLSAAISSAVNSITATGGTISYATISGTTYKIHSFTTTGNNSFIVSATTGTPTADILLVGGGGAGGGAGTAQGAGGGGGGGYVSSQTGISISAQTYTIAVGTGGTGSSGADGGSGGNTTGLGYTATGGTGGTFSSAATNGGGSGTNGSTSFTSTAGTYPYKGGNAFGSATASSRASGGGAGYGGAGVNAASASGGNGGLPIQNNIDGNNYYYASGGGGSSFNLVGLAYDRTGTLLSSGGATYGQGRATAGAGNSVTNALAPYGAGGGGAYTTSATAYAGGSGKQGIGIIRYPFTNDYVKFISTNTSSTTSITLPATIQDGDIGILFNGADNASTTAPSAVNPSGWTNVINSSQTTTNALRITAYYKVLTAAEASTTITVMTGGNKSNAHFLLYRPSKSFSIATASINQQATASVPTNQTLTMTGINNIFLGFYFAWTSGTGVPSSTITPIRTISQSGQSYIGSFEATDTAVTYSTSTISMTDGGTQGLCSFRLDLT